MKIYVMTHKAFEPIKDNLYQPLHVGHATAGSDFGYEGDDSGDNISDKNCFYSELTGLYWVWKNSTEDIVGTCHYRRYLIDDAGNVLNRDQIRAIDADIITTKELELNFSYYDGFAANHRIIYLDETAKVIQELYPEYYPLYDRLVHENHTYFGNMMIMKKSLYDDYCQWLFSILFALEKRVAPITMEEEDSYHRRIYGFISEFLLYVWVKQNGLRVHSCKVGMLGEKAEVHEAKARLREYFDRGDIDGAKAYFLDQRQKRPDLMMEASDITGQLHLCMEAIAISGLERKAGQVGLIAKLHDYDAILEFLNGLNHVTIGFLHEKKDNGQYAAWIAEHDASTIACKVAEQMYQDVVNPYQYIPEKTK